MKIYKFCQVHFLETPELAWEWAKNNVDISVDEEDIDEEGDDYARVLFAEYLEKCNIYSSQYHNIMSKDFVEIYRGIQVPSIESIIWDSIGTHWSFKKDGAGIYGDVPSQFAKGDKFILTGICLPKDIDWEYGFTSFMYYGEDQFECALDEDSKIKIIKIGNESVNIEAFA